jgi:hypothetical protein
MESPNLLTGFERTPAAGVINPILSDADDVDIVGQHHEAPFADRAGDDEAAVAIYEILWM